MTDSKTLFKSNINTNMKNWRTVGDIVMGGKSSSQITLCQDGFVNFSGHVSLENNGGFSSLRYQFQKIIVSKKNKIAIKLKGDGKKYQFRIKDDSNNYYSYITHFTTSGAWENIEISLKNMYPYYRGRKINRPNFSENNIFSLSFIVANKKDETFELLIDKIELK